MSISLAYLPNLITSIRLLLTGPIIWALLTGDMAIALYLFIIAAITDWLDGWLARRYRGGVTEFGAFFDPLADKVLLISTFLTFGYLSHLPRWLVIIAIGRDIGIILGVFIYRVWIGRLHYEAIFSSKLNTMLQLILILLLLIQENLWNLPNIILQVVSLTMVVMSIISFIQYAKLWIVKIQQHVHTTQ